MSEAYRRRRIFGKLWNDFGANLLRGPLKDELSGDLYQKALADPLVGYRIISAVAVAANALQGEAERCLAAGIDDHISKPIAMPALVAAVKKWMPPPREQAAESCARRQGESEGKNIQSSRPRTPKKPVNPVTSSLTSAPLQIPSATTRKR